MNIEDLRGAFASLGAEGYAEDVVQIGDHTVKVRTLGAAESSQVRAAATGAEGDLTRALEYLHTMKIDAISRAIIELDGVAIPDHVQMGGEKVEKHIALRELVGKWGDAVLSCIYRAYLDIEERMEMRVRQRVRYKAPDYQAALEYHQQEIEKLDRSRKERERWLAFSASGSSAEVQGDPDAAAPRTDASSVSAPAAQAPQVPVGRVRADVAPPPPVRNAATQGLGSLQLDDDSFLSADPDAVRAAIQREDERLWAERNHRASAAVIAAEAPAGPAPAEPSNPLRRRAAAIEAALTDDSDDLHPQPVPPGGPGRLSLNPTLGYEARNPRFRR